MKAPLQVYLDSSDYSDISTALEGSKTRDLAQRLIDWRDTGDICLRFSYVHIIEAAPTQARAAGLARQRGEWIRRLCGDATVMPVFELLHAESSVLHTDASMIEQGVLRNDGVWWPQFDIEDIFPLLTPRLIFQQWAEAKGLTGASRAIAMRRFLSNSGRILPAGFKLLETLWPRYLDDMYQKIPMGPDTVECLRNVFFGAAAPELGAKLITDLLRDVSTLMAQFATDWGTLSPIASWLRAEGDSLRKAIERFCERAESLRAITLAAGVTADQLAQIETNGYKGSPAGIATNIYLRCLENLGCISEPSLPEEWKDRAPGIAALSGVAAEVAKRAIAKSANIRKPRISDYGDIMHSIYIPYMDVFRADGPMADIIQHSKPKGAKIAESLKQVVEILEDMVTDRMPMRSV